MGLPSYRLFSDTWFSGLGGSAQMPSCV